MFVIIQLFFVLKEVNISKLTLARELITVLIVFSIFSSAIYLLGQNIDDIYLQTIVYIVLYSVALLTIFIFKPQIAGLSKKEVNDKKQQLFNVLNKIFKKSN